MFFVSAFTVVPSFDQSLNPSWFGVPLTTNFAAFQNTFLKPAIKRGLGSRGQERVIFGTDQAIKQLAYSHALYYTTGTAAHCWATDRNIVERMRRPQVPVRYPIWYLASWPSPSFSEKVIWKAVF